MDFFFISPNMSYLLDAQDIAEMNEHSMSLKFIKKYHDTIAITRIGVLLVILVIGIVGNTINLIVFSRRNMRKVSTFRYLMYLAVFDLLVLASGPTHLLIKQIFNNDLRIHSNMMCKLHTYVTYVSSHVSSLILMTVSIDRVIKIKSLASSQSNSQHRNSNFAEIISNKIAINLNEQEHSQLLDVKFEANVNRVVYNRTDSKVKFSAEINSLKTKKSNQYRQDCSIDSNVSFANDKFVYSVSEENTLGKNNCFKCMCQNLSVDVTVIIIVVVIAFLNIHYLFFLRMYSQVNLNFLSGLLLDNLLSYDDSFLLKNKCLAETNSDYETFLKHYFFWIDMSVYSIIPFVVMCVCSLIIAVELRRVNTNYFQLVANKDHGLNRNNFLRKIKKNRQICVMLFNSNFYFFFVMLQYWICFFLFKNSVGKYEILSTLQSFVYIFLYTNNAFEFLIFGITSEKYRMELYRIIAK